MKLVTMNREQATAHLLKLRKHTGTLSAQDILEAVQKDRARIPNGVSAWS